MTPYFHRLFSDIPLSVRVKTLILEDTPKKPYGKEGYFSKIKLFRLSVKLKTRDYYEVYKYNFENFFVLVGYFLDIPLMVRVKIPIFRDTPKKYPIRDDFFSKIKQKRRCENW